MDVTCDECVFWWTQTVTRFWWDLTLSLRAILVFFNENVSCNWKLLVRFLLQYYRVGCYMAIFHSTWLKIVSSWPTSAADHCDRLMSWRVQQKRTRSLSETGVFPSLERVSGTLCLSHYVTEISHLYSLRDFWRHFGLCRAAVHSDCCSFALCKNILIYLLTYLMRVSWSYFWVAVQVCP